jgi:hypothetical protein
LAVSGIDKEAIKALLRDHLDQFHPTTRICWLDHDGDIRSALMMSSENPHLVICSDHHIRTVQAIDADNEGLLGDISIICIGEPDSVRDVTARRMYVPSHHHLGFALGTVMPGLIAAS